MKSKVLLTLACLITIHVLGLQSIAAQEKTPVKVLLKNGLQVNGYMDQSQTSEYISLTTNDGDIFVYNKNEIKKIKSDRKTIGSREDKRPNNGKGFEQIVYSNLILGTDAVLSWTPHYIAGYRFNDILFIGGGVGVGLVYDYDGEVYASPSLIGYMKVNFNRNRPVTPYFALSSGAPNVIEAALGTNFSLSKEIGLDIGVGASLAMFTWVGIAFNVGFVF